MEAHPGPLEISRSKSPWMSWMGQTLEENKHQAAAKRYLNSFFKTSKPEMASLLLIRRESPIILLSAELLAYHRGVPHIHL